MVFNSYYWHEARLGEPELEQAREALSSEGTADPLRPFLALLSSAQVAARGIALDHFHYAEATSRFGSQNPFLAHTSEVLDAARNLLAGPPVKRGYQGAEVEGANHASALGAMMNLATPDDTQRVAAALSSAPDHVVRELALQCAETILEAAPSPSPSELTTALRRLIDDSGVSPQHRGHALHLLALPRPEEAIRLAVDMVHNPSLHLQTSAAWLLAEHDNDRFGTLLAEVVSAWPENAPYPAAEVRQILDGSSPAG